MRRKAAWAVLVLVLLPLGLSGQQAERELPRVLDLSVDLKGLDQSLEAGEPARIPTDRLVLLNGTVTNLTFLDRKRESFSVLVELVTGEWVGLEEVKSYKALVLFEGTDFYDVFPSRSGAERPANTILKNDRVVLLARALEPVEWGGPGQLRWLLGGYYVRRIG